MAEAVNDEDFCALTVDYHDEFLRPQEKAVLLAIVSRNLHAFDDVDRFEKVTDVQHDERGRITSFKKRKHATVKLRGALRVDLTSKSLLPTERQMLIGLCRRLLEEGRCTVRQTQNGTGAVPDGLRPRDRREAG
jgi:hypothetical protein